MVNLNALSRRIDKLSDDGDAERYQAVWDRFCDSEGKPRINVAGATCIEELLKLYRAERGRSDNSPD